jgi:hypothetical protein
MPPAYVASRRPSGPPRPRLAPVLDGHPRRDRADAPWPGDGHHAHPDAVPADDLREVGQRVDADDVAA